jgi:hypothetical protein
MGATVNISTPNTTVVQSIGEGKYIVNVPLPKPIVVEVKGLFPSTFNGALVIAEDVTPPEANEDFNLS